MAEISDVLTKLLERTEQEKLSWQSTDDDSTFRADLDKASVTIEKDVFDDLFSLRIHNLEGREIESLVGGGRSTVTTPHEDQQLRELYDKARRIALGVDTQLEDLLKELEADA